MKYIIITLSAWNLCCSSGCTTTCFVKLYHFWERVCAKKLLQTSLLPMYSCSAWSCFHKNDLGYFRSNVILQTLFQSLKSRLRIFWWMDLPWLKCPGFILCIKVCLDKLNKPWEQWSCRGGPIVNLPNKELSIIQIMLGFI